MIFWYHQLQWKYDKIDKLFKNPKTGHILFTLEHAEKRALHNQSWEQFLQDFKKALVKEKLHDEECHKD